MKIGTMARLSGLKSLIPLSISEAFDVFVVLSFNMFIFKKITANAFTLST